MKEKIETIIKNAKEESLLIKTEADYLNIKSKYLGKKSELVSLMSTIKDMTKEDKQTYGPLFNKTKTELENLFKETIDSNPISDKNIDKVNKMDDYVIEHFRISFGNRIMKQMNTFVPIYVACGGTEEAGIDYFIAKKILRKFEQLNTALIYDEIDPFIAYLNKEFGDGIMVECIGYLVRLKKSI